MHVLLYRSRARPGLLAHELNDIIDVAETNNRRLDVTGLLLYGELPAVPSAPGEFVQWLEGPTEAVEGLFETISNDDRHFDVEVLTRGAAADVLEGRGPGRLFPSWSMGLVRLAALPATLSGFLEFTADWDGKTVARAA